MNYFIEKRVFELAEYILSTHDTVRGAAAKFAVSKSTVHKDVTVRLEELDAQKAKKIKEILDIHTLERHLRGGEATKQKYLRKKGL